MQHTAPVIVDARVMWDMLDGPMPRGVLGLSDPNVHRVDDRWVMFIGGYSSGRRTARHYGDGSSYAIGLLEQRPDGSWRCHPEPVLLGDEERPSAMEPTVVPLDGGYRMWFLATPHEVGPGEQPDFELRATDSSDGITWSAARTFTSSQEGYFDNAVYRTPDGWAMLLARGTNLHGEEHFPAQGLWWMHAEAPSADRAAWSAPQRLLDTDTSTTPGWMGRGVCGPSVATDDHGSLHLSLTGTHRSAPWWREAGRRLRAGRRPPVPAPYHLATGGGELIRTRPSLFGDANTGGR